MAKKKRLAACYTCSKNFRQALYPQGGGWYCSPACKVEGQKHPKDQRRWQLANVNPSLTTTGYVYFIAGGGRIKIGTAKNPLKRFDALKTASPVKLKLLGFYPGGKRKERTLHLQFWRERRHGEWFDATESTELKAEIQKAAACMREVQDLLT